MSKLRLALPLLALAVAALAPPISAQGSGSSSSSTSVTDRLFLAFIEDAEFANRQWWEAQAEIQNGEFIDANLLRGTVAFQPWTGVELGGRMGFGDTDTPNGIPDGSGGTDLDVWGKYRLKSSAATRFTVGGILTVPTGDDTAGLGTDAFGVTAFGALRHPLRDLEITANAGVRFNGDGKLLGVDLDGETSPFVGMGVLVPFTKRVTVIGEARIESERFDGGDSDARILGGVNWNVRRHGMFRGAVSIGLSDGAPDAQLIAGYAAEF